MVADYRLAPFHITSSFIYIFSPMSIPSPTYRQNPEIRKSHSPLSLLRLVFEVDDTRWPADRSAGLPKGNLNPVCFSSRVQNDSRSHRRIGDTLWRTRCGTLRGNRRSQSGSGDRRTD